MNIAVLEGKLKLYSSELFDGNAQNLLIATHGGVWKKRSFRGVARSVMRIHRLKIPHWTTLFFYAPHGTTISTKLERYMKWRYPPLEAVMPGETVINYDLRHVEGGQAFTTDQQVKTLITLNRCYAAHLDIHHPFRFLDILTAEPCAPAEISLKEVLNVLLRAGCIYPRIHCTFCRHEYGTPEEEYTPGYQNITPSS